MSIYICCTYCKYEVNRNILKRKKYLNVYIEKNDLPLYSYKEDLSKYLYATSKTESFSTLFKNTIKNNV